MAKLTPKFTKPALRKAFDECLARLDKDPAKNMAKTSAGFITRDDSAKKGERTGLQVFVAVAAFDEKHLQEKPESGALLGQI